MPTIKPSVIIILGPTASGKTGTAIELAHQIDSSVISADSRQVYAGLNIGTAKPAEAWLDQPHTPSSPDIVDGIEHYLLNIRYPDNQLSLSEWQAAANQIIDSQINQQRLPVIAGGTMLYLDSLIYNFDIPTVKPNLELRAELEKKSAPELFKTLNKKDPASLDFIEAHNKRRIIRALEVIHSTGQLYSRQRRTQPSPYNLLALGLFPDWKVLEKNISQRSQQMLADGLTQEIERVINRYGADLPLLNTINYKQAPTLNEMTRANMRYAKRQMSWWKRNQNILWFEEPADLIKKAIDFCK